MQWKGVISAITTPFKSDYSVDHVFLAEHAAWQLDNGVDGIVALGSLGEAATLAFDEKVAILKTLARVMKGKPLVIRNLTRGTQQALPHDLSAREVEWIRAGGLLAAIERPLAMERR